MKIPFAAANDWLRLQAEYCLCKRFKFWQGQLRFGSPCPIAPPADDLVLFRSKEGHQTSLRHPRPHLALRRTRRA